MVHTKIVCVLDVLSAMLSNICSIVNGAVLFLFPKVALSRVRRVLAGRPFKCCGQQSRQSDLREVNAHFFNLSTHLFDCNKN